MSGLDELCSSSTDAMLKTFETSEKGLTEADVPGTGAANFSTGNDSPVSEA